MDKVTPINDDDVGKIVDYSKRMDDQDILRICEGRTASKISRIKSVDLLKLEKDKNKKNKNKDKKRTKKTRQIDN